MKKKRSQVSLKFRKTTKKAPVMKILLSSKVCFTDILLLILQNFLEQVFQLSGQLVMSMVDIW